MHLAFLRDNFYFRLSDNGVVTCYPFQPSREYIPGLSRAETERILDKN